MLNVSHVRTSIPHSVGQVSLLDKYKTISTDLGKNVSYCMEYIVFSLLELSVRVPMTSLPAAEIIEVELWLL